MIPVIGAAASQVAAAANIVQNVAVTARDIIQIGENFEARLPKPAVPDVEMKPATNTQTVINVPKRLPTAEELFGVLPSQRTDPVVAPIQGGIVRNRSILPLPSRRKAVPKSRKPKPSENTYKSNIPGVNTQ
jgi:hypothetical protein